MIKIDKGSVYIEGNGLLLCSEVEELLRQFRKAIASTVGEDEAEILISEILENSKRPDKDGDKIQHQEADATSFQNFIRGLQQDE